MSRIGKAIITIPAGVKVNVNGQNIKVEGPKGKLETTVHELISINLDGDKLSFTRPNDEKFTRAMHGTTRALVANSGMPKTSLPIFSMKISCSVAT